MNENLRKLVSKCWVDGIDEEIFDHAKFSELIIAECCRIVNLWTDAEPEFDVLQVVMIKQFFDIK